MASPLDIYRNQARLIWQWRGGPLSLIRRAVITLLVSAVALVITDWIFVGFSLY
jgi:hypothetical protein